MRHIFFLSSFSTILQFFPQIKSFSHFILSYIAISLTLESSFKIFTFYLLNFITCGFLIVDEVYFLFCVQICFLNFHMSHWKYFLFLFYDLSQGRKPWIELVVFIILIHWQPNFATICSTLSPSCRSPDNTAF